MRYKFSVIYAVKQGEWIREKRVQIIVRTTRFIGVEENCERVQEWRESNIIRVKDSELDISKSLCLDMSSSPEDVTQWLSPLENYFDAQLREFKLN